MKELIEKLKKLEMSLSKEKGNFALFILINDEELINKYHLLLSSKWLNNNDRETFSYLIEQIKQSVNEIDMINISRITVIDTNSNFVKSINSAIKVEHGNIEIKDSTFDNILIKQAYFITSNSSAR